MSKRVRCVGLLLGIIAVAGALALAAPQPPDPNKELAQEQLKLIDQVFTDLDRLHRGGELSVIDPKFNLWARRRLDALRAAGAGREEMIKALEQYVDRLKTHEENMKVMYEKNMATLVDISDAKYQRLEAEMWVGQEKAR